MILYQYMKLLSRKMKFILKRGPFLGPLFRMLNKISYS